MWSILIMVVGLGLIYFLNTQTVVRSQTVSLDKKKRRSKSILEAVFTRVLLDIRSKVAEQHKCSLDPIIAPTSREYIKTAPKIFPKESVYIEEFDADNHPTGRFEATETNPKAWIEKAPGSNPGLYLIVVNAYICPRPVTNRNYLTVPNSTDASIDTEEKMVQYKVSSLLATPRPANQDPITEIAWKTPCVLRGRAERLKFVEYRGFFDTRSMAADYIVYFDRSEFTNTAYEEPSYDEDEDQESRLIKSETTGVAGDSGVVQAAVKVGGILRKRTGSNDDAEAPLNPSCSLRLRDATENALDSILLTDPCARVTSYMVAGSGAAAPPNNIRCLGPAAVCNRSPGAKGWDLSTQRAAILQTIMGSADAYHGGGAGMCAVRPAGRFSLMNVLTHYGKFHQPSIDSIDDASRGLRRMLMVVGDGVAMGGDSTTPGQSMIPAQVQNIAGLAGEAKTLSKVYYLDVFSTQNCASGGAPSSASDNQFLVEGTGFPSGSFTDSSIFAGDKVFISATGGITGGVQNPWKRRPFPRPPGSTVIRSVIRIEDGLCVDILKSESGQDVYELPNYPYFLKAPVKVSLTSGDVRKVLEAYNPYKAYQQELSTMTNTPTIFNPDLRNGFVYFPLPRADLDEEHIYNTSFLSSIRSLPLQYQSADNLTSSYASYLRVFSGLDTIPEGFLVYGINTTPSR